MGLRTDIVKCIRAAKTADEAARLICGYLYARDLAEPGNGWFDDDPDMAADLGRSYEAWQALSRGGRR